MVEKLIWAFIFSEPEQAFQAAEQCNRRVGKAFRRLEEALQKALE